MTDIDIRLPDGSRVSGLLTLPDHAGRTAANDLSSARALLVLAHGAGAGMRHPFMQAVADRLANRKIATIRYQFPYMEAGRKRPDEGLLGPAEMVGMPGDDLEGVGGWGYGDRSWAPVSLGTRNNRNRGEGGNCERSRIRRQPAEWYLRALCSFVSFVTSC